MRKNIEIVRCDRCGDRMYKGEYWIATIKRNVSTTVHSFEICKNCQKDFYDMFKYQQKVYSIWNEMSEEKLIED